VGTIPGVDFGAVGEGYIRCCFAREPDELDGALAAMCEALAG
jgi:aspartate/methionine/tyrosine aminotransferase